VADRKVSVRLTAEARDFKKGVQESIDSVQKLSRSGEVTKEALAQLDRQADRAAVSLLKLAADGRLSAAELKKADHQVDELRGSLIELGAAAKLTGFAGQISAVEAEVVKARARVKELGDEFRATGSASSFRGLKDAQSELKKLEGLAHGLRSAFGDGPSGKGFFGRLSAAGMDFATNFSGNLSKSVEGGLMSALTSPEVWIVAAPVVLGAASILGAAAGGAILAGIGAAGIGAGIAGQFGDPKVKQAADALAKDVGGGFRDATSSFRDPIVNALAEFEREFNKLQPGIKATEASLAPLVGDLAHGAAGFVDTLVPGLERAAIAAKPIMQDLGQWLPGFGRELGDLFVTIAKHADEARDGIRLLTNALDALIQYVNFITPIASKIFDIYKATQFTVGAFADWHKEAGSIGPVLGKSLQTADAGIQGTETSLEALLKTLNQTKVTADSLAGAMSDKVFNGLMSVDQANLSVAQSLTQVTDALKTNGRELDISKAKGQANRSAVLSAVQANIAQYDSLIQSGIGAQDAARAYDQNTAALERQLRKAGLTKSEIDGLIGKYRNVPDKVNTLIAVQGLTDAINRLTNLIEHLNGLDGQRFNTYVVTHYSSTGQQTSGGTGQSRGSGLAYGGTVIPAANGMAYGIYPASNPPLIKFAEPQTRGETLIPNYGIPAARGLALADYAASHYGGRVTGGGSGGGTINLNATFVLPSGEVVHKQLVRYALDTNRMPSQLFPASSR
jgi:hypothetical protein